MRKKVRFEHKGYMGEKRKQLVKRFGYDTRDASHLIRLLNMGSEILLEGKVNVYRENDAQMYIDIKQGKWTLDRVKKEAKMLFAHAKHCYDNTVLPAEPELKKIEETLIYMLYDYIHTKMKLVMDAGEEYQVITSVAESDDGIGE